MIEVRPTKDIHLIRKILSTDILAQAALEDKDLDAIAEGKPISVNLKGSKFLEVRVDGKVCCIVKYEEVTSITVMYHWFLLPKYWGTGVSDRIKNTVDRWFMHNTQYHKVILQTPQCCIEVIKAAARAGFEIEGVMVGAIYWRKNIENLVLMSRFIRR